MRLLKTFFRTFWLSFTQPAYYRHLLEVQPSFSIKFFLGFTLLTALVSFGYLYSNIYSNLNQALQHLPKSLAAAYPDELIIKIENGAASTNVVEPYSISFGDLESVFSAPAEELQPLPDDPANLLVIDTQAAVEDFWGYSTVALLTEKSLVFPDNNNETTLQVISLTELNDLTIDAAKVTQVIDAIQPYLKYVLPMVLLVLAGASLFFWSAYLTMYALYLSAIIWALALILKPVLSYRQSLKFAFHLLIIPTTLLGLLSLLDINPRLPFSGSLIVIATTFLILKSLRASAPRSQDEPPHSSK